MDMGLSLVECQLLEKKLGDSQLFFEFEKIIKQKNNCTFTTALLPENSARNRFTDVIPYEDNRVRLSSSKDNRHGYINASHITASVGSHQRFYIAAQTPLPSTIGAFWQMVWEAEVYLIISLPAPGEEITPYLPTPDRLLKTSNFEVLLHFSQTTGHCATSKFRLHHVHSRSVRGVWHLQYSEWGHQGCPNTVPHFLGFLEELSSVREHTMTEIPAGHNRNPPVLMHCGSGVGPTAVTMLSDLLLFTHDHNQELDVARVVNLLRHQRMLMIQNISQYRFVHSLLIYYLKNSRLI